jgi:hypothetical protein
MKYPAPDVSSPWKNLDQAGAYLGRHRRFVSREIRAGRLRAARIGGRGEWITRAELLDQYVLEQTKVVEVPSRRRAGPRSLKTRKPPGGLPAAYVWSRTCAWSAQFSGCYTGP